MKNEKKHIHRLFQEKLKDFEATPSNAVWENINAELRKDEKSRKIIPLWIKLSGIAAVLLLMFTVGNTVFNNTVENPNINTVVDSDSKSNPDTNETILKDKQDGIIDNEKTLLEQEKLASEDPIIGKSNQTQNDNSKADKLINNNQTSSDAVVSNTSDKKSKSTVNPLNDKSTVKILVKDASGDAVVQQNDTKNTESEITNVSINKEAVDTAVNKNKASENAVTKTTTDDPDNTNANNAEITKEEVDVAIEKQKIGIEEALAENTLQDNVNDVKKKSNKIDERWKVSPRVAPVYFNSLGSGSSIDAEFVNNSKSGDINMSYGVSASYALDNKINIRIGVNNVKLGLKTNDAFDASNGLEVYPVKSVVVNNIEIDKTPPDLSYVDVSGMRFAQVPEQLSNQYNASINQELGFIEIPLEIEYELSDQKLGLRLLGGMSALFLNENEVYSTLNGETTLIGKATNINKTSFSANLGVGLDFKLSEKLKLNLEPTFKYQLNTFSNTSGDFKPYFIGIYSGFSFKF